MHPVVTRITLMFLLIFAATSIGDVWTTELGRRLPNTVELNPAGFQPLLASIVGEIVIGVSGVLLVALGAMITADTLAAANEVAFWDFLFRLQARFPVFLLVFGPLAIAELRVIAIVNNGSILAVGKSPINEYVLNNIAKWTELPNSWALPIMFAGAGLVAYIPVMWTIYFACNKSRSSNTPNKVVNTGRGPRHS